MATKGTRLHAVLAAGYKDSAVVGRYEAVGEGVYESLQAVALLETTLRTFNSNGTTYVMIGEHHYTAESKERLTNEVARLARDGAVHLYVEAISGEPERRALSQLFADAGLEDVESVPFDNEANSLLDRLQAELGDGGPWTPFAARPEYLEASIQINPEHLSKLIAFVRICNDMRVARINEAINAIGMISDGALGSALALALHYETEGLIDRRFMPVVRSVLQDATKSLRHAIKAALSRPRLRAAQDAMGIRQFEGPLIDAASACVFAPHVVSDAVFATKLLAEGTRRKPVLIVAGKKHTETLERMLKLV